MKVLTMFRNSIAVLVLLTVILSTSSLSVSAEESLEDVPQTNYTYWIFENEKTAVVDRAVFTYEKNLDGKVLNGSGVSDICHDADGRLYVLDGENGKVVVLSPQHQIEKIIDGFLYTTFLIRGYDYIKTQNMHAQTTVTMVCRIVRISLTLEIDKGSRYIHCKILIMRVRFILIRK